MHAARAFARNLARLTELPIALWDERLSTAAVERGLIAADISWARRAEVIDQHAAAFILQGALDRLARGPLRGMIDPANAGMISRAMRRRLLRAARDIEQDLEPDAAPAYVPLTAAGISGCILAQGCAVSARPARRTEMQTPLDYARPTALPITARGVIGRAVAGPDDVLVGPNQDQARLVGFRPSR